MGLTRSGYLKAMGIDVWTSRPAAATPSIEAPSAKRASPVSKPAPKPAPDRQATREPVTEVVPEFMLALFHYETIGLCLSIKAESELPRRFCDDIAKAMGGKVESVRYQLLKWPMLSTSGIDQSINAAREVVTQKFRQMPSKVMVFGDEVGEYYNPLRDLPPVTVGSVGAQSFLMVPSLDDLLGSGQAKRELMLVMHQWRSSELP